MSAYKRRKVRDLPLRERPLARLNQVGPMAMSTIELLATVLRTADALDLAHDLLHRFGDLVGILKASSAELCEVLGIGPAGAAQLHAALELGRRVARQPEPEQVRITCPDDAANFLMTDMMFLEQEHLRLILLDTRNLIIDTPTVYVGSLNTTVVRIGDLFKRAIRCNAAAMIVAHNHPSGDPSPSPEDVSVTKSIVKAGELMNIQVLDHVIIGRNRYVSLKERGLGFDEF